MNVQGTSDVKEYEEVRGLSGARGDVRGTGERKKGRLEEKASLADLTT
jgi:hypothetical protein